MKAMMTGFAGVVLVAVCANLVLNNLGFTSQDVHSGASVRLD